VPWGVKRVIAPVGGITGLVSCLLGLESLLGGLVVLGTGVGVVTLGGAGDWLAAEERVMTVGCQLLVRVRVGGSDRGEDP
jgi:hypothetical protein